MNVFEGVRPQVGLRPDADLKPMRASGVVQVKGDEPGKVLAMVATSTPCEGSAPNFPHWLDMAGANLSILNSGRAPVVLDHALSVEKMVGVVERAWIAGDACWAVLRFGTTPRCREVWQLVADGVLSNISIGANARFAPEPDDSGTYRAEYWVPHEVSLCPVPANWQCRGAIFPMPHRIVRKIIEDAAARAAGTRQSWLQWAEEAGARLGDDGNLRAAVEAELDRLSAAAVEELVAWLRPVLSQSQRREFGGTDGESSVGGRQAVE